MMTTAIPALNRFATEGGLPQDRSSGGLAWQPLAAALRRERQRSAADMAHEYGCDGWSNPVARRLLQSTHR
jgi:hypothetical protein